jgi:hypothetical protein
VEGGALTTRRELLSSDDDIANRKKSLRPKSKVERQAAHDKLIDIYGIMQATSVRVRYNMYVCLTC